MANKWESVDTVIAALVGFIARLDWDVGWCSGHYPMTCDDVAIYGYGITCHGIVYENSVSVRSVMDVSNIKLKQWKRKSVFVEI